MEGGGDGETDPNSSGLGKKRKSLDVLAGEWGFVSYTGSP